MSGDVQPRKRKDKKRKKDDLGVEEPRGTAAVFGEGDVFMHSQHEHGTGGHWCAKIIFFSLLAILITLIGLIILENRGLTELEANSVESRYSGVLEGWLEDAPEDDHHDEHTLELNHPDEEEDVHGDEHDIDDELDNGSHEDEHDEGDDDEHNQLDDDEHNESEDDEDHDQLHDEDDNVSDNDLSEEEDDDKEEEDQQDDDISQEEDEDERESRYKRYVDDEDEEDSEELQQVDDYGSEEADEQTQYDDDDNEKDDQSVEQQDDEEDNDEAHDDDEEDEEHEEEEEEVDTEIEIERIEREVSEEEPISTELPALPEEDDEDDSQEISNEIDGPEENDGAADEDEDEDAEFLEDDADEPPIERITAPAGKPFVEVEEEVSSEQPPDTLAEEEQYEKQQEELRREQEKTSHMWLKLTVGGALLVATHAVMRRATGPRDAPEREEHSIREETPLTDRRMTLIPEESPIPVTPKFTPQESYRPIIKEEDVQRVPFVSQSAPPQEEEDEDEEEKGDDEDIETVTSPQETEEKELYSDEEDVEEEEEVIVAKKESPKQAMLKTEDKPVTKPVPEPEDDDPDDVEIIDDEQLEEEMDDEEDEEDISDVDDVELLTRLEAKYGRLPEPERPGPKHKDGGNSIEDEWPGEPSDAYWRQELDSAEREIQQGEWGAAARRAGQPQLRASGRARWLLARAADLDAEARKDNRLLTRAITAYLDLLKMNERLSDKKLLEITDRTLDRIKFRGNYLSAEPVYRLLIRRFPEDPSLRNNLAISFLMANRADLAETVLKETLERWPNDRVALAHYGFVLKTQHSRLEEAIDAFQKALEGDAGPANEPRFYYHLGDALLMLGRTAEAHEVHKRGAALKHFLSPAQRSLYNVPRLKSRPWWKIVETPYIKLARALEKSWKDILKEGEAAKALYEKEKEGLKERGEWSQLDLFVRGQEIPNRCMRAPVTCAIVKSEPAAASCRRGQVKFSAMRPGTHVRAHVGPTNCRLRMHLALSNTKDTFIRVDQITRQWEVGKVLMFDDSFEHEVWHNGTGTRLVLIVDVWHPDLTPAERRTLPAI